MYVCMYVCVHVAIHCPRAHHAVAHVQASVHKLGKDRQRSPRVNSKCSSPNKMYGAASAFLKLTSHAGRLRKRTAGRGKPRETMLLFTVLSVQSMI